MIIDIHTHTSNKELWGLHTKSANIETIERNMDAYNIDFSVIMPTYFPFKGTGVHNYEVLKRIEGKTNLKAFGSLELMMFMKDDLIELEDLASYKKIIGIKLYPGYQEFQLSHKSIFEVYELASFYKLPIAIHMGELHQCCKKRRCERCKIKELGHLSHPKELEGAVKKFPNLNFIACHMANPYFDDLLSLMKKYDNIYTDISGQFKSGTEEDTEEYREFIAKQIQKFIELDPRRICFGSDFPIQSLETTFDLLDRVNVYGKEDLILYKNAQRIMEV